MTNVPWIKIALVLGIPFFFSIVAIVAIYFDRVLYAKANPMEGAIEFQVGGIKPSQRAVTPRPTQPNLHSVEIRDRASVNSDPSI